MDIELICAISLSSVMRRLILGGWGHWSKTFPAHSSAQSAVAAGRSYTQLRSEASAPDPLPSMFPPASLWRRIRGTISFWSISNTMEGKVSASLYDISDCVLNYWDKTIGSAYQQSISSSQECGVELEQCAAVHLPWRPWGSWLPAHRCCDDSSWGHTPLCFSQHQIPRNSWDI